MVSGVDNLLPRDGEAFYLNDFFDSDEAHYWYNLLRTEIYWQSRTIKIFGREVLQPRLMAWYGDDEATYKYSGTLFAPLKWTSEILNLKNKVEETSNEVFNSALFNLYRDQNDSMGAHRDNERELGHRPTIASLSFGAVRPFVFRHIKSRSVIKLDLLPGSLLIMGGETQHCWKHELPKLRNPVQPRINVTFRKIILPRESKA